MKIGDWIRRARQASGKNYTGKWHLVESIIEGDAITRCGRRMDRETLTGGTLDVSVFTPITRKPGQPQLCHQGCDRGIDRWPEDDPSAGSITTLTVGNDSVTLP